MQIIKIYFLLNFVYEQNVNECASTFLTSARVCLNILSKARTTKATVFCHLIMEEERDLCNRATNVETMDEYLDWIRRCDECLRSLRENCRSKRQRTSTGTIHSLVARILQLTGVREALRGRFEHVGGGRVESQRGFSWSEIETAFDKRVLTGAIINLNYIEPLRFLEDARYTVLDRVRDVMGRYNSVKVNTAFNGEFVAGDKIAVKTIVTKNHPLLITSDLREWYGRHVIDDILASLEEFQERDSGWTLSRILNLIINVNMYNPMRVGCYIDIPREIRMKRAVINVRSTDDACFAWAVVAALYPVERNAERSSRYPHYSTVLNLESVELPMSLNRIEKFERLNEISINVYTIQESEKKDKKDRGIAIVPLFLTNDKKERHVNLLYLYDTRRDNIAHFAYIKNLSRLVASQLTAGKRKAYICDR